MVGKPPHMPAGKARADEENRRMNKMTADDLSWPNPALRKRMQGSAPAPDTETGEPPLRAGQRPGVHTRLDDALERAEEERTGSE